MSVVVVTGLKPIAPAKFHAVQSGMDVMPDFELWNATAPIGRYPAGSTLSRETIEAEGYYVPPAPTRY